MNHLSATVVHQSTLENETVKSAFELLGNCANPNVALIGKKNATGALDGTTTSQPLKSNVDMNRLRSSIESAGISVGCAMITSAFAFDKTEFAASPDWISKFDGTRPPLFELVRSSDLTVLLPHGFTAWQLRWLMRMSRQRLLVLDRFAVETAGSSNWSRLLKLANRVAICKTMAYTFETGSANTKITDRWN